MKRENITKDWSMRWMGAWLTGLRRVTLLAGALLLIVTFTPVVRWSAVLLSGRWNGQDGDILVVLGGASVAEPAIMGENSYWRTVHAVWVWRHGHFRNIVVAGKDTANAMKQFMVLQGVPEKAIIVETESTSTRENALLAKPILERLGGRLTLLSSDYHMYRAVRCFARVGLTVAPSPAPDAIKRSHSLALRWQSFLDVAREVGAIVYYRARGWI